LHARVGGISQKMLSQNLKALVRAGLVARHVAPTNPPQVTYSLTELGASLAGPLTDLIRWFGREQLLATAWQHAPIQPCQPDWSSPAQAGHNGDSLVAPATRTATLRDRKVPVLRYPARCSRSAQVRHRMLM
jgi:hypothetical protein